MQPSSVKESHVRGPRNRNPEEEEEEVPWAVAVEMRDGKSWPRAA